jgi:hypothetical protein
MLLLCLRRKEEMGGRGVMMHLTLLLFVLKYLVLDTIKTAKETQKQKAEQSV